jgi:hypothetical protein
MIWLSVTEWIRCVRKLGVISGVKVKVVVARRGAVDLRFVKVRVVLVTVISLFIVWICG